MTKPHPHAPYSPRALTLAATIVALIALGIIGALLHEAMRGMG